MKITMRLLLKDIGFSDLLRREDCVGIVVAHHDVDSYSLHVSTIMKGA